MRDIFGELRRSTYLKKHLNWKMPICQHMMYLLIDEDRGEPVLGERELPWGAPDAAAYIERFKRNFYALENVPALSITFDIAAVDVESIIRDFPEVVEDMKLWYQRGKLDFVGGTFSQAHIQALSSEANWRQFEFGTQLFKFMFGKRIKLYATQETGLHEQLPQLLRHFDIEVIVMPQFPWAIEITDGKFEVMSCHLGASFIREDEFVRAVALDGTEIPTYLTSHVASYNGSDPTHESGLIPAQHAYNSYNVKTMGISKDLYGPPTIWPYFPDMMEVDNKFFEQISEFCEVEFLETAILKRLEEAPPRAKAKLLSHWSYYEGVWAEELNRANKRAEEIAIQLEAVRSMASIAGIKLEKYQEIYDIWHTILKYQHHDVLWIEVTDLRRKAINYLKEAILKSKNLTMELCSKLAEQSENSMVVFNTLPNARKLPIEFTADFLPTGSLNVQKFEDRYFGTVDLPSGGFTSYTISNQNPETSVEQVVPKSIVTKHYEVALSETGLMTQIISSNGDKLLNTQSYYGGQLKAMINEKWVNNINGKCRFFSGSVSDILERNTSIDTIPVLEKYFFFKEHNLIKVELEMDFNGNEVGYYWLDETKLNVYYPTVGHQVYHDIPFGFVEGRQRRPLFAINWLYCGGLVYVNRGTVKHWVDNNVIANVIAWGSCILDNRIHFDFWTQKQQYDIRLYGRHKIEYYLIPFGEFDGNKIVRTVNDAVSPVFMTKGRGNRSFYNVPDDNIAVTAIYAQDKQVWMRGYKMPSNKISSYRNFEIFNQQLDRVVEQFK